MESKFDPGLKLFKWFPNMVLEFWLEVLGSKSPIRTALASSYPPSNGAFKPEASNVMSAILAFLLARGSPLMINVHPYFAYSSDPTNIHLNYAQFTATSPVVQDGALSYYNLFDATVDAFFAAMEKAGGGGVGVVVSESSWPSDGNGDFTTPELAGTYNRNFLKNITSKAGTPKRPWCLH
ncbi:unnamed protein product [Prunus armeniaca]|uniref:glucan endo-1,3-beta-D-glucosidase n=1 Tax=Prunus armeniaca TaxID=36596 RepID=A0A6J5VGF2_PRUAR|nr:unnamed protein product [Prunus armeniaca]